MKLLIILTILQMMICCKKPTGNLNTEMEVFQEIDDLEVSIFELRSDGNLKAKQMKKIDRIVRKLEKKLANRRPKFMKRFERRCSKVLANLATKPSAKAFKKELWKSIYAVCTEGGFGGDSIKVVEVWKENLIAHGGGSSREEHTTVDFPGEEESFSNILMTFELGCPNEKCDHWDRVGSVFVRDSSNKKVEISRFVTPYRVGAKWQIDVTDLRPLLTGAKEIGTYIDTWAFPGSAGGDGWNVSIAFTFFIGEPSRRSKDVISLLEPIYSSDYGNESAIDINAEAKLSVPSTSNIKVVNFITGHGQANTDNCAEFCPKDHTITVNGRNFTKNIWRTNCASTITLGPQKGNMSSSRAGWCPGAKVNPWSVESSLSSTDTIIYNWAPGPYNNNKNSGYNGGSHTPPKYYVSAYLVEFE